MIGNMSKKSNLESMVANLDYQLKIDALADSNENTDTLNLPKQKVLER